MINLQNEVCIMADGNHLDSISEEYKKQKRLELILKSAGVGTWEWNIQTGESIYNERWAEILGYTLAELEPTDANTWISHTHPEDMAKANKVLQEHFQKNTQYYSFETRMRHKDGRWIWILNTGRVIERDAKGAPLWMFGTHMDITRLKLAEQELRDSEERSRLALECTDAGLWDLDITSMQFYASLRCERMIGYRGSDKNKAYIAWRRRWHPKEITKNRELITPFLKGEKLRCKLIHRLKNKDGSWRWCILRGGWLKDKEGKLSRCIGTLADISDLMSEREKNKELERIFAVNPDLLCIANTDSNFLKTNQAWMEILGYSQAELDGGKFLDLVHPDDMQATLKVLETLEKQKKVVGFINRYRHKDGSYRYLDWRAHPYGRMLFAAARDVTEKIKQEEKLQLSLRIKAAHLELLQLKNISLADLLDKSLEEVVALTGSEMGYIFLYDEEKQEFMLHSWSDTVMENCSIKEKGSVYSLMHLALWGEAVRKRQAVVVNDYLNDDIKRHGVPKGHVPVRKFLSIPVMDREKIVAVVGLANKKTDYNEEDIFNLKLMMNIVWSQNERIKGERKLLKERILFGATVHSLTDGVIVTDENGKIMVMNRVAEDLTGWTQIEGYGKVLEEVLVLWDADKNEPPINPIQQVLSTGNPVFSPPNIRALAKNGKEHYIAGSCAPAIDRYGNVIGTVLNFRDITENWLKQKEDEYHRTHDALTGAYNRAFFENKIEEEMARAQRYEEPLSMAILDVDKFKLVNDTWGHPVGDAVLKKTAELAQAALRKTDFLVRLGGEEFIVLMPETSLNGALQVAEKIRFQLEAHQHIQAGQVTASFGVAEWLPIEEFSHWYKRTDSALYRAKGGGRNCVIGAEEKGKLPVAFVKLEWISDWESGHEGIDKDHKGLLDLGNRLISMSLAGIEGDIMNQCIEDVLTCINQHFTNEESVLSSIKYPEVDHHRKIHLYLMNKMMKLRDAYQNRKLKPTDFFSFIVDDLIVGHILKEDILFFPYLNKDNSDKNIKCF